MSTPAIWFPTVRTNTGTDVFTQRLVKGLNEQGIQAEITWLPLRAEYAPWAVPVPVAPTWATVVHVNTWLHPRFIPGNLPLVATIHHATHHPDAQSYKGWLRAAYHKYWIAPIERRIMQRADNVIAVSQFVAESAKKTLVNVSIKVIYNGIDTNIFEPANRANQPKNVFRLIYVGGWKRLKGVDLLAPIMRELGEDFELLYTGGPASDKDKASMPANMIDIGRLQDDGAVAAAIRNADALLFPSRSEGFGLVAVEALACGLPVVASCIGPFIEIISHGETGLLCLPNDVTGFVAAVRKLSTDQALLKTMRCAAPNHVLKRFSEKTMVGTYLNIYYDISSSTLRPST